MNRKVGQEFDTRTYWAERSQSYIDTMDGPYHRHRMSMILALCEGMELRGSTCLDAGCGEGIFARHLVASGATVKGFDIDERMIRTANDALQDAASQVEFTVGGIDHMRRYRNESFHYLFALNVLAYTTPDQEDTFYREAQRVLKPGGTMILTHSNELFDLYTLNRYTVDFFKRHFSIDGAECNVAELLKHPEKPSRAAFPVRENPLAYAHKLATYGFKERRQEFAHFHALPPLLMPARDPDDINAHTYRDTLNWPATERWKLAFMCSMFGSAAVKAS